MGQNRGLAGDPDYVPPAGPGQMHSHKILPGEMSTGQAVFRGFQRSEADVQARRTAAKRTLGMADNADPRDTNLPAPPAAPRSGVKPRTQTRPRAATRRR